MFVIRITLLIWSFNFNSPSTVTRSYPAERIFLFRSGFSLSSVRWFVYLFTLAHFLPSPSSSFTTVRFFVSLAFALSFPFLFSFYLFAIVFFLFTFFPVHSFVRVCVFVKASCKHAERLCKLAHHYHLHLYSSNDSHLLYFEVTVAFGCILFSIFYMSVWV